MDTASEQGGKIQVKKIFEIKNKFFKKKLNIS